MKKATKLLALLLSLCMMLSAFAFTVFAETQSGTCGDNLTWTLDDNGTLTISGEGDMDNYDYYYDAPWNFQSQNVKSVIIENSVTSIGDYAFEGCSSLKSIEVPDSVTSIGDSAFSGCSSLASVSIPDSVTSIGNYAFYGCSSLKSIMVPDSVTSIGRSAFEGCSSLESIRIPDSVTEIGDSAFEGCSSSLESIVVSSGNTVYHSENNCLIETESKTLVLGCKNSVIPSDSSVTSIGYSAFEGCSSLASIVIPDSVTSIGSSAFSDCSSLESIVVSEGNTVYHSENNCLIETKRKTLILGCKNSIIPSDGSVTSIGRSAFYGCSSLVSISIPDSVTSLGNYAFFYCSSLASISIPDSLTSIGRSAFEGCSSLVSIMVPDSVTYIGDWAFILCSSLESIRIPDSVTYIGDWAFRVCSSLESIVVSEGNTVYHSENNCLIETESKTLVLGCKNSVIPSDSSVTSIGDYAFYRCSSLESISIPDSVTSIGRSAFYGCSSLVSISIPDSVTSIGRSAFEGCSSLVSISIPDSVTSIGNYAFEDCSSLASISIPDSVTSIGSYAFYGCSALESISIPDSVTSIGNRALGYYYDYDIHVVAKYENFTISGAKGSAAEDYATENGFKFVEFGSLPDSDTDEYMDTETATMPNVAANTKAETIVSALANYGITATVTDKNGNALSDTAKIGTGCKVKTADCNEYTVIVKGDVDGTGEIDSTDYLQIKKVFLGTNTLSGEYFTAADTDKSSDINSTDYLQIKQHFLGTLDLYA